MGKWGWREKLIHRDGGGGGKKGGRGKGEGERGVERIEMGKGKNGMEKGMEIIMEME